MSALAFVGYLLGVAVIGALWTALIDPDNAYDEDFCFIVMVFFWPVTLAVLVAAAPFAAVAFGTYRLASIQRRKGRARAERQARIAELEREPEIGR